MKIARNLALIVALALIAGVSYWMGGRRGNPAPDTSVIKEAKAAAAPNQIRFIANAPQLAHLQISAAVAFPEPLLEPLNGRVAYDENFTARLATPVAGRVVKLAAQLGDSVAAGQSLLLIDAPEYGAALADVAKSSTDVRLKQAAFERAKSLHDGEVLARKDFESSQNDLALSMAESRRAQARLNNLTQGGNAIDGGKFSLRSPIRGVVAERKVNPGAEVRPDAPDPLFVITDPTHLWIMVDVPEKYLGKIVVGQRVSVDTDAFPGEDFVARVASIGEVLDPATRRVQVRCVIDNPQRRLKPEMFARVTPMPDETRKLVRIPNTALLTEGLYSHVFVEKEKGLFEKRRVSLGLQGRETSYVKEGLTEGDRVVVSGALLLNAELAGQN